MKLKRDSSWEYFRVVEETNSSDSKKKKYGTVVCIACETHLRHERETQRNTLSDDEIVTRLLMIGRPRSMRNHLKKCAYVSLPPNFFVVQAQSPKLATTNNNNNNIVQQALPSTDTVTATASAAVANSGVLNTLDTSETTPGLAMFSTTGTPEDSITEKNLALAVAAPQDAPNRLHNITQNINTLIHSESPSVGANPSIAQPDLRTASHSLNQNVASITQNDLPLPDLIGKSNTVAAVDTEIMWTNVNNKLDLMDQKIENLDQTMKNLQKSIDLQIKVKRLELAKSRVESTSFMYWDRSVLYSSEHQNDHNNNNISSGELAKQTLDSFILETGFQLPDDAMYVGDKAFLIDNTDEEECKNLFREKIVKQIELLIGREPRLEDNGEGKLTLYYS